MFSFQINNKTGYLPHSYHLWNLMFLESSAIVKVSVDISVGISQQIFCLITIVNQISSG